MLAKIYQSNMDSIRVSGAKEVNIIISLLNREICNKIVLESELDKFVNTKKFSQEQIDGYFIDCIQIIFSKPKLVEQFVSESIGSVGSKYHRENLITHLYCVGWICCLFADKFDLEPGYSFKLGFFHDIGK